MNIVLHLNYFITTTADLNHQIICNKPLDIMTLIPTANINDILACGSLPTLKTNTNISRVLKMSELQFHK